MNLSEAWPLYEQDITLRGYSEVTIGNYRTQYNVLTRYFGGEVDMNDISLPMLKQYYIEKGRKLKPSSLGQRMRANKALFRWASDEGYTNMNPASKLREPKKGKKIPKAIKDEDIEKMRRACKTARQSALFEFLYSTGCRVSEVKELNQNNLDFDSRSCIVHGKGDKEREVYFSVGAKIQIKLYLDSREDTEDALFVTDRRVNGKFHRISVDCIRRDIENLGKWAGIKEHTNPHRLRHTYATHLLNKGAPLEVVQDLMGHVRIETTKIYCQLSGERRREQYRKYF